MEKDKLEADMMSKIKDYEETEKIRRDNEISKAQAKEIKIERERKHEMNTQAKDEFKDNLDDRLDKYRQALREKAESEKQVKFIITLILNAKINIISDVEEVNLDSNDGNRYFKFSILFEAFRNSKNKNTSCDVDIEIGLNSDFKIVSYKEMKYYNYKSF